MDFSWSQEQLAFKNALIEFARKELDDDLVQRDRCGAFSRDLWEKCADFGIQGLLTPTEYGGQGADVMTAILLMEALGYACRDNGLIFGMAAQMLSVQMPILTFGTETQKRKYLPRLCEGRWIGAHAMSEPDSGSDAFSLKTTAYGETPAGRRKPGEF
jgi:alkylation response protein AidB-like acyl-CoA dehydrogenase